MPFLSDLPFVFAVLALGWGLSLATYRMFASRYEWPMGKWHADRPGLPSTSRAMSGGSGVFDSR